LHDKAIVKIQYRLAIVVKTEMDVIASNAGIRGGDDKSILEATVQEEIDRQHQSHEYVMPIRSKVRVSLLEKD
jgi:hypothetical protein